MIADNKLRTFSNAKIKIYPWILMMFFVSCNRYQEIEFNDKNPISYCFSTNPKQVKEAVIKKFDNYKTMNLDLVLKNENKFDRKINLLLSQNGNENDICLRTFGDCLSSKVYLKDNKPALLEVDFHVHLDSLGINRTKVTINTLRYEIYTGAKIGISDNFVLGQPNTEKVPPSTIEEYEILLAIGEELGQKGMPPCNYPKKDAKKITRFCSTIW